MGRQGSKLGRGDGLAKNIHAELPASSKYMTHGYVGNSEVHYYAAFLLSNLYSIIFARKSVPYPRKVE